MDIKETLISFTKEKGINPPYTLEKIKEAGFNPASFLLDIEARLKSASDCKTCKSRRTLKAFFRACKELL